MFEYTPLYKKYQRYNYNNYGYYNTNYNNSYNTAFNPMYNYFTSPSNNYTNINHNASEDTFQTSQENYNNDNFKDSKDSTTSHKDFRLGPIQIEDNNINAFGFSIAIDDLIIIGLMILLFFQSDKDYTLLIILGLMLFNITFSNLDFFRSF